MEQPVQHPIENIVKKFNVPGDYLAASTCGGGHINDTFKMTFNDAGVTKPYTLQRINHDVFKSPPNVMENMVRVTEHIRAKLLSDGVAEIDRRVLAVQKLIDNEQAFFKDENGNYWRMYAFIEGAKTIETNQSCKHVFEAAKGYGRFLGQLSDLPGPPLHEIIPNFHNGSLRFEAFVKAAQTDSVGRASRANLEIDFIKQHEYILAEPQKLIASGALPERATHNDTKISNVLLDDKTGEAVCVIDLDTIMPGLAMYDFGDLVRTTVSGAAEDETDLSKIEAILERFEAAANGFMQGAAGQLSDQEVKSLSLGPAFMALIMATRFLTDYLQGDTYYKTEHSEHNLQRTRSQLQLVKSLLVQTSQFQKFF